MADLAKALTAYDAVAPETVTNVLDAAIQQRNRKLEAAQQTLAQVRLTYCGASRETVRNPELLKIGFQLRRKSRSKEQVEAAAQKADAKRVVREAKRLKQIEAQEQRALARLEAAMERTRAKAAQARETLSGIASPTAAREGTSEEMAKNVVVTLSA